MARSDLFEAIEYLRREGEGILARFARANRGLVYADLRAEVVFNRSGAAVGGEPRDSSESESAAFAVSVHVADRAGPIGHGQTGAEIGALAASPAKLVAELKRGLNEAYDRARFSAGEKADLLRRLGHRGDGLVGDRVAERCDLARRVERDRKARRLDRLPGRRRGDRAAPRNLYRQRRYSRLAGECFLA